jgi:hypothetical protein
MFAVMFQTMFEAMFRSWRRSLQRGALDAGSRATRWTRRLLQAQFRV